MGRWVSMGGLLIAKRVPLLLLCTAYVCAGSALTSHAPTADGRPSASQLLAWGEALDRQRALVAENRREIAIATAVMKERVATIQAKVAGIDAATSALRGIAGAGATAVADAAAPDPSAAPASATQLASILDKAVGDLDERERQLGVLGDLLTRFKTEPRGRPIAHGWISSPYGKRIDPFTGDPANHAGVDIAARAGTVIVAVADGLVTSSGPREGYGQTVEITHRQGLVTRYAHNRENLVQVGDVVQRGQPIAHLGATGRATGPHVHFEVLHGQHAVDPAQFMNKPAGESHAHAPR